MADESPRPSILSAATRPSAGTGAPLGRGVLDSVAPLVDAGRIVKPRACSCGIVVSGRRPSTWPQRNAVCWAHLLR